MEPRQFIAHDIIECMPDGFVAFDRDWRYTYVNAHAARLFATTPQALLGKTYLDCFPEAEGTRFHLAYQQVMAERIAVHIEEYFPPWERWFENHIYPTQDGIAIFFHEITKRKTAEQNLADKAAELAEAQQLAQLGSWKWIAASGALTCSDELYRIFGRTPSGPTERLSSFMQQVVAEDWAALVQARQHAIAHLEPWETQYRIRLANGGSGFIRERGQVLLDAGGRMIGLFGYAQDISYARQAETRLHRQQQLTSVMIDALPINIFLKDQQGRHLMFNKEAARVAGLSQQDAIGKTDFELFPPRLAEAFRKEDRHVMDTGETTSVETAMPVHGEMRHMLACRSRLQVDGEALLLGFAIDITERKKSELRSEYLGSHDALTGLPNRSLLQDRLEHAIAHAHRSGRMVAVLFFDLDRFKVVNDSLGHKSGDALLCKLAERLSHSMREGDTLARLGGDEFVVVVEDLEGAAQAAYLGEEMLSRIAQSLYLESQTVTPSASMGISMYPKDGKDAATLLQNADIAMYQAKKAGGNTLRFFDHVMNAQAMRRMLIESSLRKALDSGCEEVGLHYQPIIDLSSSRMIGMEALARASFADQSMAAPDAFIPIAEETGLIVPLGEKLLRQACRDFRRWQGTLDGEVMLSVNLSVRQLGVPNLVAMVRAAIEETGMNPARLQLEITETGLMQNLGQARLILHDLARMGIHLSIDDFGTGYSSLSYLKTLPIHKLKIDRSFVRDVVLDNDDASIVIAIIGLAHNLGLKVISEGIETEEQMAFLKRHGCDAGQGYYFSRALDPAAMDAFLQRWRT